MLYRIGYAVLLIVAALAAVFFLVQDPVRDPLVIVPSDLLLIKYIKDTAYHPEVAFRYLIEEHGAPIWMKGYEHVKFDPSDSEAERARKTAEALREMKERDATLPEFSKRERSEKYLAWVRSRDQETQHRIVYEFIRWPGQKAIVDDGRWPPFAK